VTFYRGDTHGLCRNVFFGNKNEMEAKCDALIKSAGRDYSSLGQSFGFISGMYILNMPPDKISPMVICFRRFGHIEK
jgi:hypothetical protein